MIDTEQKLIYVEGEGDSWRTRVVIVGEAPGAEEEKQGRPFVGRSGQLLRSTLQKLGVRTDEMYITNVVKCRPANNRTPTTEEIRSWCKLLYYEVRTVAGRMESGVCDVIAVGRTAEEALQYMQIPHTYVWHPAYVLRDMYRMDEWIEQLRKALHLTMDYEHEGDGEC